MRDLVLIFLLSTLANDAIFADQLVELNHAHDADSLFWPSDEYDGKFKLNVVHGEYTSGGYWYATNTFCAPEHGGTHMDAPYHYAQKGWTVDQIPLDHLIAKAIVIDISKRAALDSNAQLIDTDILDWLDEHGTIPNNSVVLVYSGWDKRYGSAISYFGHETDPKQFSFPGISQAAAQVLVSYRASSGNRIVGVGVDTASLDYGMSREFLTHRTLSDANIYGLENLKNLEKVPAVGAELIVMPMKIKRGTGAPCRVIARLPDTISGGRTYTATYLTLLLSGILSAKSWLFV